MITCPIFNLDCRHRVYQIDYLTLPQIIYLSKMLFEYKLEDKDFWYQILTGKSLKDLYYQKEKEKEITQKLKSDGKLEFPDDAPYITKEEINQIMQGVKQGAVKPEDPEYWDNERIELAQSEEAWKRKIALSDWFYDWYKKVKKKGYEHIIDRETLIKKKELDDLVFELAVINNETNEKEFTNKKVIIDKSKLTPEIEEKLNELIGSVVEPGYKIKYQ